VYALLTHPATTTAALLLLFNHFWRVVPWESSMLLYTAFGVLILRVVEFPPRFLRTRLFEYLGKASYAVYMLHYFVIYAVVNLMGPEPMAAIYLTATLGTVAVSVAFYQGVEKPILRHKHRVK
jgi:peptidoglycan/LPS O-acetylase OafA/YrhL